jgi:hypothetical protein
MTNSLSVEHGPLSLLQSGPTIKLQKVLILFNSGIASPAEQASLPNPFAD